MLATKLWPKLLDHYMLVSILGLAGCPEETNDTALQVVNNSGKDVVAIQMNDCASSIWSVNLLTGTYYRDPAKIIITGQSQTFGGLTPSCYNLYLQATDGVYLYEWNEAEVNFAKGETRIWTIYATSDTIQFTSGEVLKAERDAGQTTNSTDLGTSTLGTITLDRGAE